MRARPVPEAVSVFILPPSPEVLERRLRMRSEAENVTSEEVIERRLAEARREVTRVQGYKYALVNDVLDEAVAELRAIVLAERGGGDGVAELAASCRTAAPSNRLLEALASF